MASHCLVALLYWCSRQLYRKNKRDCCTRLVRNGKDLASPHGQKRVRSERFGSQKRRPANTKIKMLTYLASYTYPLFRLALPVSVMSCASPLWSCLLPSYGTDRAFCSAKCVLTNLRSRPCSSRYGLYTAVSRLVCWVKVDL